LILKMLSTNLVQKIVRQISVMNTTQ
jgi:hypothetical protein